MTSDNTVATRPTKLGMLSSFVEENREKGQPLTALEFQSISRAGAHVETGIEAIEWLR
jgi:hypothetical protein